MKKFLILILISAWISPAISQKGVDSIIFNPKFQLKTLVLGKEYYTYNDTIVFKKLKFYISDIKFIRNDSVLFSLSKKHHLIDLENPASTKISYSRSIDIRNCLIRFNIGVDSLTNSAGALGGDLDPTYGMYWTWQSGYINIKLEGFSNHCQSRNHYFQFHVGGYRVPYSSLQTVELKIKSTRLSQINISLDNIINSINWKTQTNIMGPNKKAVNFAQIFAQNCSLANVKK